MNEQQILSRVILKDPEQSCWFEYTDPVDVIHTTQVDDVVPLLTKIERLVAQDGYFAAGFLSYEAASAFDTQLVTHAPAQLPLLCFGLFDKRTRLDELPKQPEILPGDWQLDSDIKAYKAHISTLKTHIEAGDIYQVNYTSRLALDSALNIDTFGRIAEQATYGAFLDGRDFSILSASPELFFQRNGREIICKPMKGTATRGLSYLDDMEQADWLRSSKKNQAENLMITDMVRNDLSRVADANSVTTSQLFNVERHPTVWQMTSTVSAQTNSTTSEIFAALFPGASITGAPKHASMRFINALESTPREIYTGVIGLIAPERQALFNIAIRTAWTDKRTCTSHYGAGGGIVWDSDAEDEYLELQAKTQILRKVDPEFLLLETMRWTPGEGIYLKSRHLTRLSNSAAYFAFKIDIPVLEEKLIEATTGLPSLPHRIRLQLTRKGKLQLDCEPLFEYEQPQKVALSKEAVSADNVLLYHKTTKREIYNTASASVPVGTEALLHNHRGFVTESAIANIVFEWQGELFTPPVSDGLLPGTLRESLIANGEIGVRSLSVEELSSVDALFLVNALRGWRQAKLVAPGPISAKTN